MSDDILVLAVDPEVGQLLHGFVDLAAEDAHRGVTFAKVDEGRAIARECEADWLLYHDPKHPLTQEQNDLLEQIAKWREAGLA
jgi:hypothetical protein